MDRKIDWIRFTALCTAGLLACAAIPVGFQVWDRLRAEQHPATQEAVATMSPSWGLPVLVVCVLLGVGLYLAAAFISRGKKEKKIPPVSHDECQKTIEKEKAWSKALTAEASEAKASLAGKTQQFKDEHRRCQDLVEEKQLADESLAQSRAELVAVRKQIDDAAWLDLIARTEKVAIDKTVGISSAGLLRKDFNGSAPYINFNFYIHNCSVFPISLDSVDGFVKCVTAPIGKRLEVIDDQRSTIVSNECPHGSTRSLVVRVWLLQDDLKIMAACSDLYFKFDELRIKVKGGKNWPDITSQKVAIDWVMDTNGNAKPWRS